MRSKQLIVAVFVLLGVGSAVAALDEAAIEEADALYEDDRSEQAIRVLEGALSSARTDADRAEVFWRLSRATLAVGEDQEDAGEPTSEVLATYEEGEQYGIQAVEADPGNHLGYYWQSANIGKWGQAKGILDSLFKAGPMRDLLKEAIEREPDHAGSYYVLGQLYSEVPGFISFGNVNYAVSLARKSIDLHEAELRAGEAEDVEHDYYIQLANHLIKRNWNERRREREQENKERRYNDTTDQLEKGWFYEGVVRIPGESDRDEAEDLLRDMIRRLEAIGGDRTDGQERQLTDARELLEQL